MKTSIFLHDLNSNLLESLSNNFGEDNYDELRFGAYLAKPLGEKLRDLLRKKLTFNYDIQQCKRDYEELIRNYGDKLELLYSVLSEESQKLLIEIISYRILGYKKVKLSLNNSTYKKSLEIAESLKSGNEKINSSFLHFVLEKFNLNKIGYNIELYFTALGIAIDFIIEQYAYKVDGKPVVYAESGDTVLDIGGCWGDTALYFADKVGDSGKVYSFEFIPNNLEIFHKNISLNPNLKDRINVIQNPVSDNSDQKIFYRDCGPSSSISSEPFADQTGTTQTISIDDFVQRHSIPQINYIKMDIEGAEPYALKGAINTIRKFRPKLAIAIYHSMDDFVNIPKWLIEQNLNYDFYLGHYTIHAEETILFAYPK